MTTFDPAVIGRRVREERDKAGLSLSQLATLAGVTKAYLVRLENQGGNPTLEVLASVADALDVTVADLVDAPRLVRDDLEPTEIPAALQAYSNENALSSADVRMLASIKWRDHGERPRSIERWKYIHDSIRASRSFDRERDGGGNDDD